MKRSFKVGGVPFCWHCSKDLMWKRGGGERVFALVTDQDGNEHRVHKDCLPDVLGDGVKVVKQTEGAK